MLSRHTPVADNVCRKGALDGRQSLSLTERTRAEVIWTIIWAHSLLLKFCCKIKS
jgi:hypothetical protein